MYYIEELAIYSSVPACSRRIQDNVRGNIMIYNKMINYHYLDVILGTYIYTLGCCKRPLPAC